MEIFSDDEKGYEVWRKSNQSGYVFNFFGGTDSQADMNKVHRAECTYLRRPADEGRRTVIPKFCSNQLKELLTEVVRRRNNSWSYCKHCKPDA